jgi:hypothetical protein
MVVVRELPSLPCPWAAKQRGDLLVVVFAPDVPDTQREAVIAELLGGPPP